MPSIVKLIILIAAVAMPAVLRAQTGPDAAANRLPTAEDDSTPSWVPPLPELGAGSVRIAPPVAADSAVRKVDFEQPQPAAKRKVKEALPLSPPNRQQRAAQSNSGKTSSKDGDQKAAGPSSMLTVVSSLAVVLGIFLAIAWLMRRAAPQGLTRLPSEAFEVLGRAPLANRQTVHLLRCGNKLLLVSVTPAGAETLTEITEPQEVDRLAGLCRQAGPQSSTAAFRQIFEQLASKRPMRGAFSKNEYADFDSPEGELSGTMDWEQRNG